MLEELLKHDKLGNREELLFFLFDGLSLENDHVLQDFRKYCIYNVFSISRSFDGILKLLQFISFIKFSNDKISLNEKRFDQRQHNKQSYFDQFHFYECLINELKKREVFQEIFNGHNLRFSPKLSQYYVLESGFPYKYFPFRNMLLSTGFLYRCEDLPNLLLVKKQFTEEFKRLVVSEILASNKKVKKINLTQLKKALQAKEDVGKRAEIFALEFEHQRLVGHPQIEKVEIISEEYTNAGYDIESFEDVDSIVFDRFIEVKSYAGEISFYWSKNEIEKAKELRNKYFLYLVDRSRMTDNDYKPQRFQDPYRKIFENDLWRKETENWKITFKE